ncbi:MAG: ABC transporter substrate-binding protein [Chloroflexi bacterium]|nr:ABC transporter substrate-binding protein [Chloroflexota bacterium]
MAFHGSIKTKLLGITAVLLGLAFIVACGGAAPAADDTVAPAAPAAKADTPPESNPQANVDASPKAAPTAAPEAMKEPAEVMKPEGTLNVGLKEMGPFFVHPEVMTNPQIFVQGTAPIGEGLLRQDKDGNHLGNLAESWSISDDFLTWTFNLQKGVQFHKGYGEMTAEDVVYSMQGVRLSKHPRAGQIEKFWEDREGSSTPDDYTVIVHTGEPLVNIVAQQWFMVPAGSATFIVSKKQSEEIGVEAAKQDIAATGPWEIVESKTAEFWRMEAVEGHWRQTPAFAELVFWEIPEESSRIAGFQTGALDTFLMSFDTIPLVEGIEGATTMSIPNAVLMRTRIYGNWYPIPGVETRPGYDPDLPWVSASADLDSPEWERAKNVRKALFMAMDRQAMVDTILAGFGHTTMPLSGYTNAQDLLEGRQLPDYDPAGAIKLLADNGYPDGFKITLTPSIRGAAAEVESCEIIAQFWNDIGLDVKFQRIPYGTLRPQLVARTYQGATCHAGAVGPTPAEGYGSYLSQNPFNRGLEHPWQEAKMIEAQAAVNPVKRNQLEKEIGIFLLDNALTDLRYYTMDAVWPVGPRLEPWGEFVKTTDVRQINGYEFMQHRK